MHWYCVLLHMVSVLQLRPMRQQPRAIVLFMKQYALLGQHWSGYPTSRPTIFAELVSPNAAQPLYSRIALQL